MDGRELRLSLVRGGVELASSWADRWPGPASDSSCDPCSPRKGYQTASGSTVVTLRSGDRVSLVVEEGQLYEPTYSGRGYTTFSGYRIG